MAKGDGQQARGTIRRRECQGGLEKTLGAYEVGLEARAERIAAPGNARSAEAGAPPQRIVENGAHRSAGRQFGHHGAPHHGENSLDG